ncbi:MAG: thioredoxin family protein, partial [Thermoanaerobaculia bacterium]
AGPSYSERMSGNLPKRPNPRILTGLATLAFVALFGVSIGTARSQSLIKEGWHEGAEGYQRALEESKTSQRPLAVYFYTDWCGYCRKLERDVLTQPPMKPCLSSVIAVKVNPENGPQERDLARKFMVSSFPRFFISRPGTGVDTNIPNATKAPEGTTRLKSSEEFAADCQKAIGS